MTNPHTSWEFKSDDEVRYCGDHYCTGHVDTFVICSCGWKKAVWSYSDASHEHLLHRIEKLEEAAYGTREGE